MPTPPSGPPSPTWAWSWPDRSGGGRRSACRRPAWCPLGSVDDAQLNALYRAAVALTLPSRYEGFGLPVLEAMSRDCLVVTTDVACLPEVAGGAAELVPVGGVDALAAALERILSDADHRGRMVAAGEQRGAGFSWEASAGAHATAYAAAGSRRE